MKVKLLPLAVTAAIAMPGLALADGPTVYGKMNVSLENVDSDYGYDLADETTTRTENAADNWQVISNSSRFGVKGDGKINSMLKATYVIEWGVDGADNATLSNRNRSVGLAGNFGAMDVGHFDTPLKVSQGKVDQFNDLSADLQYVLLGDNRAKNIIQYTSPDMSGLQAKLAIMPGEQYDYGNNDDPKDGLADAISSSVAFTSGPIYAALAYDKDVESTSYEGLGKDVKNSAGVVTDFDPFVFDTTADYFDTLRLVGQYTAGPVSVGAIYQQAELSDAEDDEQYDQDGFLLSGAFTMGQTVLKAQYAASTTDLGDDVEFDSTAITLGVDQKLSAQTTVFGYYGMLAYEGDGEGAEEQSKDNLGVGIVHSF